MPMTEQLTQISPSPPWHHYDHDRYHHHWSIPHIINILLFSSDDLELLCQAEHYFHRHLADDEERLYMITTYMEGPPAKWFLFKEDQVGFWYWDDFHHQLFRNFRLCQHKAYEHLFWIKQTWSMDELVGTFVELIDYLSNVPEETVINALLAAL